MMKGWEEEGGLVSSSIEMVQEGEARVAISCSSSFISVDPVGGCF